MVAGLEEGLLPHASSLDDARELEEERRLFYVALTRAKDEVLLTAAAFRRRFDGAWGAQVSRFVDEIPPALLEREEEGPGSWGTHSRPARGPGHARGAAGRSTPRDTDTARWGDGRTYQRDDAADVEFDFDEAPGGPTHGVTAAPVRGVAARRAIGQRVMHERFGSGTVLEAEGEGPDMKLTVRFTGAIKKVLARFVTGAGDVD